MLRQLLLVLAIAATAVHGRTNQLGVPSWNEMLTFLMQEGTYQKTPETGVCGDLCYLRTKKVNVTLKQGESYIDPDEPCTKYICKSSGVVMETIECKRIDDCENGPPVRFPGKCCEQCVPQFGEPCEFTEWGEYTECSRTCGGGRQARERTCCNEEEEDALECTGNLREWRDCQTQECPVDCEWEWSGYTECTVTCGGGKRTRYPIVTQEPKYGGKPCPPFVRQNTSESIDCSVNPCPVDCKWLEWSPWSDCTTTCGGGKQTRERGKIPAEHNGRDCVGDSTEERPCSSEPCPVDCKWLEWSAWSTCTKTCGGGTQTRTRGKIPAEHNGRDCVGDSEDVRSCNSNPCPVDCKWLEWSAWSTCTKTCGGGTQTRRRGKIPAEHNGRDCVGDGEDVRSCNSDPCPVDCKWLEWSAWSDCTKTCGGGTQFREREKIPAEHGGRDCVGENREDRTCNNQICPVVCKRGENFCDKYGKCIPDQDKDCIPDEQDNCIFKKNYDQKDQDGDKVGDACDNCINAKNPDQKNTDGDISGDACDPDIDDDQFLNQQDKCPLVWDPEQIDTDGDGAGDACDNCKEISNNNGAAKQRDSDGDGVGDACEERGQIHIKNDRDGDGILDGFDNCRDIANPLQEDSDHDLAGDACDNCPGLQRFSQRDLDGDGVGDPCDNCLFHVNKPGSDGKQADKDNDCIGDVCDNDGFADSDGDGVADKCDNCKDKKSPNQIDSDGDGVGDECDNCPNRFLPSNHCQGVENLLMMENMTEDEQKSLAAKIMERLLEMYFT